MKVTKNRVLYFDLLNIAACLGVIWLHCSGDAFTFRMDKYWLMSLAIQVAAHFAVPVFFMLTGANLMGYKEKYSTKMYFKRRLVRTFLPFLLWSTIYLLWKLKLGWIHVTGIKDIVGLYSNNGIEGIFWFFYPLFAIYLCMPVLHIFADKKHKKILYYMVVLGVLAYTLLPLLPGLFNIPYSPDLNPPVVGSYMMYVLLGWILKHESFDKKVRQAIYGAGIFGALCMFGGTILLSLPSGKLNDVLWDYMAFPTLFMACAVFLFFKHCSILRIQNERFCLVAAKLSSASFGVYLIHIMLVDFLTLNGYVNGDSRWWMLFGAAGVYIICVFIVICFKKIPVVRYLFP